LGHSPKTLLADFLRRVNPNYPNYWHSIENDQHMIGHLVNYLVRLGDQQCLQSILHTRVEGSDAYSPNAWHSLKSSRSQEDSFRTDIQKIYEVATSWTCTEVVRYDILARSFLSTISINETNKTIDVQTCINLVKAGLWSEGLALSHARLHFGLPDLAEVARHLSEPLKSMAIEEAIKIAEGSLRRASTASAFVKCALIWRGPLRVLLLEASTRLLDMQLSGSYDFWSEKATAALNALRASIELASGAEFGKWSPIPYLAKFVAQGRLRPLPSEQKLTELELIYLPSVLALETLLYVAVEGSPDLRLKALKTFSSLQGELLRREDYLVLAFKLKAYCKLDAAEIDWESVCLRALSSPYTSAYATVKFAHSLGDFEGISGFSRAVVKEYRHDPTKLSHLLSGAMSPAARGSLLEHICTDLAISFPQLLLILGQRGWLIDALKSRGRIAPSGNWMFQADKEYQIILRATIRRLDAPSIDREGICADICRISNDVERVDVIEIMLSCLKHLRLVDAEAICSSFSNLERRAVAQLMTGSQLESVHQREFLLSAIANFREAKSSVIALQALGAYLGSYNDRTDEAVQAAAAFAEGIGDTEELKIAFARAAIHLGTQTTSYYLNSTFWRVIDSLPVESPPISIPKSRSLCCIPFWHPEFRLRKQKSNSQVRPDDRLHRKRAMANAKSSDEFLKLTIAHFSEVPEDTTRAVIYEQLADIAQELTMRGLVDYAAVVVSAMYDTAIMYR
jgi:hypothetical protein